MKDLNGVQEKQLGAKPRNKENDELLNFALLIKLMAHLGQAKVSTKNLLNKENQELIVQKLKGLSEEYDGIKILGYKTRNIPTNFKPNSSNNPEVIQELYLLKFKDSISNSCTLEEFDKYQTLGSYIFEFFISNYNLL